MYGAECPLPTLLDHLAIPGWLEDQKPVGSVRRLLSQPNRWARTVAAVARFVAVTERSPAGDLPRLAPDLRYAVESTLRAV